MPERVPAPARTRNRWNGSLHPALPVTGRSVRMRRRAPALLEESHAAKTKQPVRSPVDLTRVEGGSQKRFTILSVGDPPTDHHGCAKSEKPRPSSACRDEVAKKQTPPLSSSQRLSGKGTVVLAGVRNWQRRWLLMKRRTARELEQRQMPR